MHSRNLIVPFLLCAALSACEGSVKESLGLSRKAPDEFRVYSRPPLSVPPEFNLRPPANADETAADGAPLEPTGPATRVTPVESAELPSGADAQFLQNAGAHNASGNIRRELRGDAAGGTAVKDDRYFFGGNSASDPTVDAEAEAKRLKDNKAANKPVTEGDTPTIQPKSKGILGDLF